MKDTTIFGIVAFICLTVTLLYALSLGIDGVFMASIVGLFSLIIGAILGAKITLTKIKKDETKE